MLPRVEATVWLPVKHSGSTPRLDSSERCLRLLVELHFDPISVNKYFHWQLALAFGRRRLLQYPVRVVFEVDRSEGFIGTLTFWYILVRNGVHTHRAQIFIPVAHRRHIVHMPLGSRLTERLWHQSAPFGCISFFDDSQELYSTVLVVFALCSTQVSYKARHLNAHSDVLVSYDEYSLRHCTNIPYIFFSIHLLDKICTTPSTWKTLQIWIAMLHPLLDEIPLHCWCMISDVVDPF